MLEYTIVTMYDIVAVKIGMIKTFRMSHDQIYMYQSKEQCNCDVSQSLTTYKIFTVAM